MANLVPRLPACLHGASRAASDRVPVDGHPTQGAGHPIVTGLIVALPSRLRYGWPEIIL